MFTILLHIVWPYCDWECRYEMCCTQLAGNAGAKSRPKFAISAPLHNFLCLYLRN